MNEELFLEIGIGTRCRRIYELLSTEMDKLYSAEGVDMSVREFPIIYSLVNKGPISLAEIQQLSGLSHSAISQTVKKMAAKDILSLKPGKDARSKIVSLTKQGDELVKTLKPIWKTCKISMQTVLDECNTNILSAFTDYERALKRKSFTKRYAENKKSNHAGKVEMVAFDVKYRDDWCYINKQWIDELFIMEHADLVALNNPEKYILNKGGEIYFALLDGKPVGAIALKYHDGTRFELSKMGVLPEAKGLGIGNILVRKILERYKARGGTELFLETNSSLVPAITLYKKWVLMKYPHQKTHLTSVRIIL